MILSFKPQFVDPILHGRKIHTIREDLPGRWKPENKIHMATGVRTKNYNQFNKDRPDLQYCRRIQQLKMQMNRAGDLGIWVDGQWLPEKTMIELIENDGLTVESFREWFFPDGPGIKNRKLIHWTDKVY